MKKITWRTGMHQLIESGHKTFDRQTTVILTGNQIGDTVSSSFIRPADEVECNHRTFEPGRLQNYDLSYWPVPFGIRKVVQQLTDLNDGSILYRFFHWGYRRSVGGYWEMVKIEDGWGLTTTCYGFLRQWITGPTYKSRLAVEEAKLYVIKNHEERDVHGHNRTDTKRDDSGDQRRDAKRSRRHAPR